jgi:hypothetical protein
MFQNSRDFLKQLGVFALGKSVLTFSVFAAGFVGASLGFGALIPALIIGAGGFALTAVRRFHSQGIYEDNMVNLYRDNIADQLGIAPEEVTRAHLKEAAKDNEIIAKALSRQRKKTFLTIATAALASVVSIGLIGFTGVADGLVDVAKKAPLDILKDVGFLFGASFTAGISNLIIHEGLDALIGYKSGLSKAAAHDLIYQMDLEVKRGKPISREEVFGVMVAGDESLHTRVTKQYGKEYRDMTQGEKSRVLHDLNLAATMDKLAIAISEKKIRPGYLAYAADDPRLTAPRGAKQVEDTLAPEKPSRASFVERLGLMPRSENLSHAERFSTQAAASTIASAQR